MERLPRRALAQALLEALRETFPTPYPVTLRWVPRLADDRFGVTRRIGRRFVITLSESTCSRKHDVVETVLHEYAHAIDWRHDRVERRNRPDHPEEFWIVFGRLYRAYWGET